MAFYRTQFNVGSAGFKWIERWWGSRRKSKDLDVSNVLVCVAE